jgi:hypothetical protein
MNVSSIRTLILAVAALFLLDGIKVMRMEPGTSSPYDRSTVLRVMSTTS